MGRAAAIWEHWRGPAWMSLSALGALALVLILAHPHERAADALAYWSVDPRDPYVNVGAALNGAKAFRYSPAAAWLLAPLGALPWMVFIHVWTALQLGALAYVGRRWALALILLPPVFDDLAYGNINLMLAAAIVAALRGWAGAWAFVVLTKVTPAVGLLWYAVRGEWRALAVALATVLAVVMLSLPLTGVDAWVAWGRVLTGAGALGAPEGVLTTAPLPARLVVAAIVVALSARTDRRWGVALGCALAMPVLWPIALAVGVAAFPWVGDRKG